FLDHALEHARYERDAACLDRLQVARREEPGLRAIALPLRRVRQYLLKIADPRQRARGVDFRDGIVELEPCLDGRRNTRKVVQRVVAYERRDGTVVFRHEGPSDQRRALAVGGETRRYRQSIFHCGWRPFSRDRQRMTRPSSGEP